VEKRSLENSIVRGKLGGYRELLGEILKLLRRVPSFEARSASILGRAMKTGCLVRLEEMRVHCRC
jgi:hypothetical protein